MTGKRKIWRFINDKLADNKQAILLSVLSSKGGSPGKAGFKLAVTVDELAGTIGGGAMEYNLINEARGYLQNGVLIREIRKLIHNKNAAENASGLICTGNQTVCIFSLTKNELPEVEKICGLIKNDTPFVLSVSAKQFEVSNEISEGINIISSAKEDWKYFEEIPASDIIYIAGGGHVGRAVARIMKTLDFKIKVIDPRPDIISGLTDLLPDEKLLSDFESAGNYIGEGKNVYVTILTSSHLTDKIMLKQVITRNLKYIGMMGSAAKIKRIYTDLEDEGIQPGLFKKVNAPVGLEINSLTPAEIAVSIAAEIIKVKNSD